MPLLLFKLESTKSEPNAKGRLARLWINSDSALPLGGVPRSAENRNGYDSLSFDRNRRRREIDELTRGEFLNEDPDIRTDDQEFDDKQREVLQEIQSQVLAPSPSYQSNTASTSAS